MLAIGNISLILSFILSIFSALYSLKIIKDKNYQSNFANTLFYFSTLTLGIAFVILIYAFLNDDFSNLYIWQHSNTSMNPIYKLTALWGGMDGSMLLWAFILSLISSIAVLGYKKYPKELTPWLVFFLNTTVLFFLTIIIFVTNPFRFIGVDFIPSEGNGLNPLLQNPYMAIHPPLLYLGFTTFAIPYAFCMAALSSRILDNRWLELSRKWTMLAWCFLTAGIALGSHWAYLELGWGGFWAWDPVENSSFLPWLTGTAFLHSIMVEIRRGMLRIWNIILIISTFCLTIYGTFLTRSGIVQSVHAFASTDIGWVFLLYLFIIITLSIFLILRSKKLLQSKREVLNFFSKEVAFLLNNLVLVSICFATLWGVMFPVFSEAITGEKQTVTVPYFNAVNIPLFLFMLFIMSFAPFIEWKEATIKKLLKKFLYPILAASFSFIFLTLTGINTFYTLLSYSLSILIIFSLSIEIYKSLLTQTDKTVIAKGKTLVKRQYRRLAGFLVHIGVAIAIIGITASMSHKFEKEFSLGVGESIELRRFKLELNDFGTFNNNNYEALYSENTLYSLKDNKKIADLKPELRYYFKNEENTSEVSIKMSFLEDFYLVLAGVDETGTKATYKVYINPLQVWLWIGVLIMLLGGGLIIIKKEK